MLNTLDWWGEAGHGSLAVAYICLGVVSINNVFSLKSFPDNMEIVSHGKGTATEVTSSMDSRGCNLSGNGFIGLSLFSLTPS